MTYGFDAQSQHLEVFSEAPPEEVGDLRSHLLFVRSFETKTAHQFSRDSDRMIHDIGAGLGPFHRPGLSERNVRRPP
jgi:hypothetical protein